MRRSALFALVLVAGFATSAWAQVSTDSSSAAEQQQQIEASDSLLNALHDWDDLHRTFPALLPRDDGYVADGISDFIVQRLAKHWSTFPHLAAFAEADTAFGSWVVSHIDATTDWDDLARIERHARGGGPSRYAAFQRRVLTAAHAANIETHRVFEEAQHTQPKHAP